jgi:hypothetical protein
MKFNLPLDVEKQLEKKFKERFGNDFEGTCDVINDIFSSVLKKCLIDGSCIIRNLGTLFAYTHDSNRTFKKEFKLKFKMGQKLDDKIKNDELLFNNIPYRESKTFSKDDKNRILDKVDIYKDNHEGIKNIIRGGKKMTNENLTKQAINDILNSPIAESDDSDYFKKEDL